MKLTITSERDYDRLSRRDALAATIVGLVFGAGLVALIVYVTREPAPPKPAPLVLPPEALP